MTKLMKTTPTLISIAATSDDGVKQSYNRKCTHWSKYKHKGGNSKCWELKSNKDSCPERWVGVKEQKKETWQRPVVIQVVRVVWQQGNIILNKLYEDYILLIASNYWV